MSSQCPFLKDLSVRFCELAPAKKLVPSDAISLEDQRCTCSDYKDCPLVQEQICDTQLNPDTCPFIHSAKVNYCSAAGNTKFIPVNEDRTSRCNTSAHNYCELFLQFHGCKNKRHQEPIETSRSKEQRADCYNINTPDNLSFSNNHMWMDVGEDGGIHIGVDSFLTRVFGPIESIRFISGKGLKKPTVILTINSVDLPIVFPRRVMITSLNKALEDHPERLHDDPYGSGWLFEYLPSENSALNFSPPAFGLIGGSKAPRWMENEVSRMASFLQDLSNEAPDTMSLLADGGQFRDSVARDLSCPDLILMYNLFFSPIDRWKK